MPQTEVVQWPYVSIVIYADKSSWRTNFESPIAALSYTRAMREHGSEVHLYRNFSEEIIL